MTAKGKSTIKLKLPRLYPKQHRIFFDPARIVVCEASTKAGKTVGAHVWLLAMAVTLPMMALLWVSPIYAQAKMQGFDRVIRMMVRADPKREMGWSANKSDLWIQLPNGSRIWFKGGDNPDSIYGADYAAAVIDEATRCKQEVWHAVRSTLTATKGPARLIGNVKGRANWAYKLARLAESGEPNMAYYKLTALDSLEAGIFDQDEFDDAKRVLPEQVFKELYLAEPADDGGNPFGIDAIRACIIPDVMGITPILYGIDLAKSHDWTVVCGLDYKGRVTVLERWQGPWEVTKKRIISIVKHQPALVDSTGVGDPVVEDLQRKLPQIEGYKFSSQSKQQLMEGLANAIQTQAIGYPDGWLVNELESFEYEYTRTGVRYNAPQGLHDDGVCALSLAARKMLSMGGMRLDVRAHGTDDDTPDEDQLYSDYEIDSWSGREHEWGGG